MKYKEESNFEQSRGKLLYKSKTPINTIIIIAIFLIDMVFIYLFFEGLYLLIESLIALDFPEYILPIIIYMLSMAFSGFLSSIFTYVIVRRFITYLFIYEKGIEIRKTSLFPLKFKKFYISYGQITKVEIAEIEIKKGQHPKKILIIRQTDGSAIRLLYTEIEDLEETKNLILKYRYQTFH